MAAGGVAHLCVDPVVLSKRLAVWASESIVGSPAIALVFHQEDEAAASMSEVAEAGFWIFVLAAPPGKQVTAEC